MTGDELEASARKALAWSARCAAQRLAPGRGPVAALKRALLRWALGLYFSTSIKPHPAAVPEPTRHARSGDAAAARRILAVLMAEEGELARGQLAAKADVPSGQAARVLADLNRRGLVALGRNTARISNLTEA